MSIPTGVEEPGRVAFGLKSLESSQNVTKGPGLMKLFRFVAFLLLSLVISTVAVAAEKDGVTMPNTKSVAGKSLVLNGMGTREATIMYIDVYVAGLYLESKSQNGKAIAASDQTKQLVLHFVRDVGRDDIVGAWNEGFGKNTNNVAAIQSKINQLNSWMSDVKEGQEMVFTFNKDGEMKLTVKVKGVTKGTITGSEFARVFLLIWLGDDPPNKGLREGLLGK